MYNLSVIDVLMENQLPSNIHNRYILRIMFSDILNISVKYKSSALVFNMAKTIILMDIHDILETKC